VFSFQLLYYRALRNLVFSKILGKSTESCPVCSLAGEEGLASMLVPACKMPLLCPAAMLEGVQPAAEQLWSRWVNFK